MTTYARDVSLQKIVTYRVAPHASGVTYAEDVETTIRAARAELRQLGFDPITDSLTVTGDQDSGFAVSFRLDAPTNLLDAANAAEAQRFQLATALATSTDTAFDKLLTLSHARSQTALLAAARLRTTLEEGEPIPALLPRDWPRLIKREIETFGTTALTVDRILRLLDDWVLAGVASSDEDDVK